MVILVRYRCIEEYVDENGNVIEEGKQHFTTPAPVREFTVQRRKPKMHRINGVKNTAIPTTARTTISKGIKVTMVKKRRKMKLDGGGEVTSISDSKPKLTRVYAPATVPISTTTALPITEIAEDDGSADATIMKHYFKPMHVSTQLQQPNRVKMRENATIMKNYFKPMHVSTQLQQPNRAKMRDGE
ncbi:unnamed protein product [Strongylus vulgaris]|uniref:Uncharacterized protein n=1 Tax=Strongylus vulgaris TaxID=40348 RepID=A0A3P7JH67_STRVU|nr:unnamed protein product [Strongylus vulgaris]